MTDAARRDSLVHLQNPRQKTASTHQLTRNSILDVLGEVTVTPITSTIRHIPTEVILTVEDGMPQVCAINLDHVQTVAKAKVGSFITALSDSQMDQVKNALLFALGY